MARAKKEYVKINPMQEMADAMIAEIQSAIADGRDLPWKKAWIGGGQGMPRQIVTGKPYRGINSLILWLCGKGATRFATSKTITAIGGKFLDWETGKDSALPVVFFSHGKSKTKKKKDGSAATFGFLKRYKVYPLSCFDLSDVDPSVLKGADIVADLAPVNPIASAQAIVDAYKGPEIVFGGSRACYSSLADRVESPNMSDFLSAELFYSVLFHELGHSTGHAKRLARPELVGGAMFGDHRYSQEELCAEFTAAMLCQRAGITTTETHDNSVAYLRGWLKALKDSPEMLVKAGWAAQKAADYICGLAPIAASA